MGYGFRPREGCELNLNQLKEAKEKGDVSVPVRGVS